MSPILQRASDVSMELGDLDRFPDLRLPVLKLCGEELLAQLSVEVGQHRAYDVPLHNLPKHPPVLIKLVAPRLGILLPPLLGH
jgi:hypothetical protein